MVEIIIVKLKNEYFILLPFYGTVNGILKV
jgi:hypothetical protein